MNLIQCDIDKSTQASITGICATCTLRDYEIINVLENEVVNEGEKYSFFFQGQAEIMKGIDFLNTSTIKNNVIYSTEPIFIESVSPFDELYEKLPDEQKIKILIEHIREELNVQYAHELAARLNYLHEIVNEDPNEVPISIESLSNFINFLFKSASLKCPDVVLTPSNEIRAQWRTANNRHFAAVFLPTGEARFVIFTPNPKDPDKIDRLSGNTSVDSLMETIQPHRVLEWASI